MKKTVNGEIKFQIIDWNTIHEEVDYDEGEIEKYVIRLYGRTQEDKTVFMKVENFTPYFYVEIPMNWKTLQIKRFMNTVKQKVYYKKRDSLISYDIVQKHKFYGFSNDKLYKFLQLKFHSFWGLKSYEKVFKNPILDRNISKYPKKYNLYESNIEPALRFMHIRNIQACGWIKVKGSALQNVEKSEETVCDINFKTDWHNICPVDNHRILPIVVASFDIECTSGDGSFPCADRDTDKIIQIGTTFHRYGEDECFYKHIVTLGSCDKIKDVDVESYENEGDVLLAWTKMISRTNPDILTGYNIFGFDYKYMNDRAVKLGVKDEFMKLNRDKTGSPSKMKTKELVSSALGRNIMHYFEMNGRIQIDLMKVVQRDYSLSSYKLDSVAGNFIRENIIDADINIEKNLSTIKTQSTYGLKKGGFITIYYNDGLTDNKYNDGEKFKIKKVTKDSIIINGILKNESIELDKYKVFWCQAKDDVPPHKIFSLQEGSSSDRAIIAKYCIKDCELVNKLVAKLQVLTNNISMANVCSVPLSYLFLRGQGVKIFSLVSKKCRGKNYVMPVVRKKSEKEVEMEKIRKRKEKEAKGEIYESDDEEEENNGYEGATVFKPVVDAHFTPIPVLDYASLYPRSMIHRNVSHECLLNESIEDKVLNYRAISMDKTLCYITNKELLRKLSEDYKIKLIWKKNDRVIKDNIFDITKYNVKDECFEIL
jgi:DNA polymerase elongation subunit (family B)